jgi:hypothetical protein
VKGESRPKTRTVWFTCNEKLLDEFDALVPPKRRSREIEAMVRERVVRHRLADRVPEGDLADVLALID